MLSVVRLPTSTVLSFDHLIVFCHHVAPVCPAPFLSNPDALEFLVACVRSPDIGTRICSQRALIDACAQMDDSSENVRQSEPSSPRTLAFLHTYHRDREPHISKVLKDEEKLTALANEYKTNQDCSHLELGQELAALISHCESTVRAWTDRDAKGGAELLAMLRVCEEVVRNAADEGNGLDVPADILRIQILVAEGEPHQASSYAQEAIKRHPSVPFFYYTLACLGYGDRMISRVLYADKGLQCVEGMTDYLHQQLLCITIRYSHLVVARMAEGLPPDLLVKELDALTGTALANVNIFSRVAPLDHSLMPLVSATGTHIELIRNGHLWKDDKFRSARKSFTLICDIARCTGRVIPWKECYALQRIVDHISSAWNTWGSVVSRQPKRPYESTMSDSDHSEVNIAAWFEKLNMTPCFLRAFEIQGMIPGGERRGTAQLHTCSYCNSGNAILKKCAGCQKAQYCDNICQKRH
ncbi:hypothetical protein FB45DRAFT_1097180 [Roridomyces roridus]|uniref:MYND-type domain-containing protein n=1 Tax=Roridomyces roridus TaxID=1738132 RepID=A0AAD7FGA6_9AGAR|nr:hypothetical protein FB45DRAFT_1097180 [Roridomyces roridus]